MRHFLAGFHLTYQTTRVQRDESFFLLSDLLLRALLRLRIHRSLDHFSCALLYFRIQVMVVITRIKYSRDEVQRIRIDLIVKRVLTDFKSVLFFVFTPWSVSTSLLRRRFSAAIKGITSATDASEELISLVSCSKGARRGRNVLY